MGDGDRGRCAHLEVGELSPFDKIEMCRDLVPLLGVDAAATALAESSGGFVPVDAARDLVSQPGAPGHGRIVVAERRR